jgi:predicted signal transduction protein with EAL and GGDEF domain
VTDAQPRKVVTDAGCVLVQGELFGLPVPAEYLEARVAADAAVRLPKPRRSPAGRVDVVHRKRRQL